MADNLKATIAAQAAEIERLREALIDLSEQADDVCFRVRPGIRFDHIESLVAGLRVCVTAARTALQGENSHEQ